MDKKSIMLKVLTPIILTILLLSAITFLKLRQAVTSLIDDFYSEAVLHKRKEIINLFKQNSTEEALIASLNNHLSEDGWLYKIEKNKKVIGSSSEFPVDYKISKDAFITATSGGTTYYGFVIEEEKFGLNIYMVKDFPKMALFIKDMKLITILLLTSVLFIILSTWITMRKNLAMPIKNIISKLDKKEPACMTNIKELDELVAVLNDALLSAKQKSLHAGILHEIAVAMNKNTILDEIMDTILEKSSMLINAELSALAIYDEKGFFKKLKTHGVNEKEMQNNVGTFLPVGKGILKFMQLSLSPVRINNVAGHHAFSGSFPEGHPVIKNFLGYPIFSNEGRPLGALYFANKLQGDFTENDEDILVAIASDAAVALQRASDIEELKRFKKTIESAFDVIIISDKNGYITYVNPAFESTTGFTFDEVRGKSVSILKSGMHDSSFYANLWETITSNKPWKGEFINRKKNGELYNTSAIIFPILSDKEKLTHFVSIQRDITEEKKLYEQLLRAQKMEAIGTLAGGIAHDFNNLLTAILGYSEIILNMIKEDHPFHKPVSIIYDAAQKGAALTKNILMVARKEKIEMKPVNVNEIIQNSMELLQRTMPKNIEIITNLSEEIPLIKADPSQIYQVIMNLCVNAKDAMLDGGRLTIETSTVSSENGAANGIPADKHGFLKLSISDTGIGIDTETQRKIFDPFFTTKTSSKGTGLGLYIVHSVITNHNGYINVYSEPGKGSRFNIYIPAIKYTEPVESEKPDDLKGSGTILIIDDEQDIRDMVSDMIEGFGYKVIQAEDGINGIKIFRQMKDEIDLVLLDMIMPKMGGNEVFQALKTIKPEAKIIICSGYSYNGFTGIDKLIKSGANGFVQKPFTSKTIALAIKKALSE